MQDIVQLIKKCSSEKLAYEMVVVVWKEGGSIRTKEFSEHVLERVDDTPTQVEYEYDPLDDQRWS